MVVPDIRHEMHVLCRREIQSCRNESLFVRLVAGSCSTFIRVIIVVAGGLYIFAVETVIYLAVGVEQVGAGKEPQLRGNDIPMYIEGNTFCCIIEQIGAAGYFRSRDIILQ